ncbi:hypothetical protein Tco_0590711 [Tanacetum coccineum]
MVIKVEPNEGVSSTVKDSVPLASRNEGEGSEIVERQVPVVLVFTTSKVKLFQHDYKQTFVLRNENSICLLFDLQSKEEDEFTHRTHLKSAFHQGLKFITPRLSSRAKDDIFHINLNPANDIPTNLS